MASFGAKLKQEREKRKVSLDDVAQSTKISTRLLLALEHEHLDQLPGGIFNKGFIRAYARFLGMDEEELISDYGAATGTSPQPENAANRPAGEPALVPKVEAQANLPWGMAAVLLLILALGFALWGFYTREAREQEKRHEQRASEPHQPVTPAPLSNQLLATGTEAGSPTTNPRTDQVPPEAKADGGAVAKKPENPATTPAAAAPILVVIKAQEDSWISIKADGKEILQDTMLAESSKTVRASKEVVVRAGNIGGLEFEFNGHRLAVQGDQSEVKTLTFGPNGLIPAAPSTP